SRSIPRPARRSATSRRRSATWRSWPRARISPPRTTARSRRELTTTPSSRSSGCCTEGGERRLWCCAAAPPAIGYEKGGTMHRLVWVACLAIVPAAAAERGVPSDDTFDAAATGFTVPWALDPGGTIAGTSSHGAFVRDPDGSITTFTVPRNAVHER